MQSSENVLARDDTFFGVCEALGEDFRFNPNWLRVALGVGLLLNPLAALAAYAAGAVIVGLSRWLVPNPRLAAAGPEQVSEAPETAQVAEREAPDGDNDADRLAVAA
jgi:phage shock protein C